MIESFRRVPLTPAPVIVRVTSKIVDRANRVDIWRGGTWNARPIRSEWRDGDRRGPAGIFVDESFVALTTIMNSPEAADPLSR